MPLPVSKLDIEEAERLPDRLLPQPHGFEGLVSGLRHGGRGDLAVADAERLPGVEIDRDAAGMTR